MLQQFKICTHELRPPGTQPSKLFLGGRPLSQREVPQPHLQHSAAYFLASNQCAPKVLGPGQQYPV
eukprot:scaffold108079_cov19-Tisochrysis_lutea.AAC.2